MNAYRRLLSLAILALPAVAAAQDYFPLEVGNQWTYSNSRFPEAKRVITITGFENGFYIFDFNGEPISIAPANGGVDIVIGEEGPQIYYRFDEDAFLHRDFHGCDDNRILSVVSRKETVDTPAGSFESCIQFAYDAGNCADAGTFVEWWAPDVGKVKWEESNFAGSVEWVLEKFGKGEAAPEFKRGDVDSTGVVELSDAVVELEYLFLSGPKPGCIDAADANDDGDLDVSDPITILSYLYLGTGDIPAPGATLCGRDTTDDQLLECVTSDACIALPN